MQCIFSERTDGDLGAKNALTCLKTHHNRHVFFCRHGIDHPHNAIVCHGSHVAIAQRDKDLLYHGSDALVTCDPALALALSFADCNPVLLFDKCRNIRGLMHCSRQSIAAGIIENTIREMSTLGARSTHINALIGPGLCPSCHQLDTKRFRSLQRKHEGFRTTMSSTIDHVWIDMPATITTALLALDLSGSAITSHDTCTNNPAQCTHGTDVYFSCRGDQWIAGNHHRNNLAVFL